LPPRKPLREQERVCNPEGQLAMAKVRLWPVGDLVATGQGVVLGRAGRNSASNGGMTAAGAEQLSAGSTGGASRTMKKKKQAAAMSKREERSKQWKLDLKP